MAASATSTSGATRVLRTISYLRGRSPQTKRQRVVPVFEGSVNVLAAGPRSPRLRALGAENAENRLKTPDRVASVPVTRGVGDHLVVGARLRMILVELPQVPERRDGVD